MEKKRKSIVALVGILLLGTITGTLAYWNQTMSVENPFDTGKFGSTVVEDFKPEEGEDWKPGAEINKDVLVKNTGDYDLIVRVKLDEKWTRKGENNPYKEVKAEKNGDVYIVDQHNATDGLTSADKSVVEKNFATPMVNWLYGNDGWYYYRINLKPGAETDQWLDSVTLLKDADMGKMETLSFVTSDAIVNSNTTWHPYSRADKMPKYVSASGTFSDVDAPGFLPVLHNKTDVVYAKDGQGNTLWGYSNSNYLLTVTVQTVQATEEAVRAVFNPADFNSFMNTIGRAWVLRERFT